MVGSTVGNYRILDKIGDGGMGEVYRAHDVMLDRTVALKSLRPELARRPEIVARFETEAQTLARLVDPNIATVFALFRDQERLFLCMEYVGGRTLESVIRARGHLPVDEAVPIALQALDGIGYAHRNGVVHRDLKPANLMVTDSGTVKIMDFGIARVLGSMHLTRDGRAVGTVPYMAPEQIRGEEVDARTDLYALGVVLYELLCGRVPFDEGTEFDIMRAHLENPPPSLHGRATGVPPWLDRATLRALAKEPADRFQSAEEFAAALTPSRGAAPRQADVSARPALRIVLPWIRHLGRTLAAHKVAVVLAVLTLVVLVEAIVLLLPHPVAPPAELAKPPASTPAEATPPASPDVPAMRSEPAAASVRVPVETGLTVPRAFPPPSAPKLLPSTPQIALEAPKPDPLQPGSGKRRSPPKAKPPAARKSTGSERAPAAPPATDRFKWED